MDHKFENDIFERDISIEEFDHITDGVEDHVFSKEYLARKESIMKTSTIAKISSLRIKVAAAACAFVVASPFVANAAMDGALFNRIWGNEGKQTVESHQVTYVEDGKLDKDGKPVSGKYTMPKIEYTEQDPEVAKRLLSGKIATNPVSAKIGDSKITVESVVRDGTGIVASYTVEKAGGVDCFNYSQFDNEAKGAWFNEDQNIRFSFAEGTGKIWVDLSRSTKDKLYCYEYMCDNNALFGPEVSGSIKDHITLNCTEYKGAPSEAYKNDKSPEVKETKSVKIPVAEKLESKTFTSSEGSIKLSAIAMGWTNKDGRKNGEPFDSVKSIKINYKDGTVYDVYEFDKVESVGYICGMDNGVIALFNRLVDTENVESISINDIVYK